MADANITTVPQTEKSHTAKEGHRVSFNTVVRTIPPSTQPDENVVAESQTVTKDLPIVAKEQQRESVDRTDPWSQKTVLCLDGGGIRGYSTLLILRELMTRVEKLELEQEPPAYSSVAPYMPFQDLEERRSIPPSANISLQRRLSLKSRQNSFEPKAVTTSQPELASARHSSQYFPCHYFDYVAGTSTGGLIAIMLGRLRMSVNECIDQYVHMGGEIFGTAQRFSIPPTLKYGSAKKNSRKFEQLCKEMVDSRRSDEKFASSEEQCKTIVVTIRQDDSSSVPFLFRTYRHQFSTHVDDPVVERRAKPFDLKIWQACRATTASPLYFKPIKIEKQNFVDGGMGYNNPSWLVLNELEQIHHGVEAVEYFLSVGSGVSRDTLTSRALKTTRRITAISKYLVNGSRGKEGTAVAEFKQLNHMSLYERWDVSDMEENDSKNVERKLWRKDTTLKTIAEATEKYLSSEAVLRSLDEAARKLVQIRRRRANTTKWEVFALGVKYKCTEQGCTSQIVFRDRNELVGHMQRNHDWSSPGPDNIDRIDEILKKSRVMADQDSGVDVGPT